MPNNNEAVFFAIGIASSIFLILAFSLILFSLLYQRKKKKHLQEKQTMQAAFAQEILQSQLEVQNQTLQYVGQELHDNLGQLLSVVRFGLNSLEENPLATSVHPQISETNDVVAQAISDLRALSKSLDGDFVQDFGLSESLAHELQRIKRTRRFETDLTLQGEPYSLGYQKEIVLFRIVQEVLNNAMKHAEAKHLGVILQYKPAQFTLSISDDGKGFDYERITQQELSKAGAGLRNIRRRSELIGGTCTYQTAPNQGTKVLIELAVEPNHIGR